MSRDDKARNTTSTAALLEELEQVAGKLGFEVRREKLLREVGYRVRSGGCRVRALRLILLDRGLPPSAQVDVLASELSGESLDDLYLSPAARRLLEAPSAGARTS